MKGKEMTFSWDLKNKKIKKKNTHTHTHTIPKHILKNK